MKRLLRFSWSNRMSYKNHSKAGQNRKYYFDLRWLLWFPIKTIEKRVKIEKVSKLKWLLRFLLLCTILYKNHSKPSQNWKDCFDLRGLIQKPFKNGPNLYRLLQFAWSRTISYKYYTKTSQNWTVASICVV